MERYLGVRAARRLLRSETPVGPYFGIPRALGNAGLRQFGLLRIQVDGTTVTVDIEARHWMDAGSSTSA